MSVVAIGPGHYLYQAQYEQSHPDDILISLRSERTPFVNDPIEGLRLLLALSKTVRKGKYRWAKTFGNNLKFAVPPIVKKIHNLPEEIDGVQVLVNKSIPVTSYTSYFTNQTLTKDIPEEEVIEKWTAHSKTSVYLYDCENMDIYEIRDVEV